MWAIALMRGRKEDNRMGGFYSTAVRKYGKLSLLALVVALSLTACYIAPHRVDADKMDTISTALTEDLDQDILMFTNVQELNGCYYYYFLMDSEHFEDAEEEIRKVYTSFEELLTSGDYDDKKLVVDITYNHYAHGAYCTLAEFCNGSKPTIDGMDDGPYDHVVYVGIPGITEDADFYEEDVDYELNQRSFWDFTSDATEREFGEEIK